MGGVWSEKNPTHWMERRREREKKVCVRGGDETRRIHNPVTVCVSVAHPIFGSERLDRRTR